MLHKWPMQFIQDHAIRIAASLARSAATRLLPRALSQFAIFIGTVIDRWRWDGCDRRDPCELVWEVCEGGRRSWREVLELVCESTDGGRLGIRHLSTNGSSCHRLPILVGILKCYIWFLVCIHTRLPDMDHQHNCLGETTVYHQAIEM